MGEIVLAAKCTHVPTMLMSEQEGPVIVSYQEVRPGHVQAAGPDECDMSQGKDDWSKVSKYVSHSLELS